MLSNFQSQILLFHPPSPSPQHSLHPTTMFTRHTTLDQPPLPQSPAMAHPTDHTPMTSAPSADDCAPDPDFVFQRLDKSAGYPYTRNEYIKRFLWEWVQRTFIRFSPRRAHGWRKFWLRLFGAKMGVISGTKASTRITHPWLFSLGEHAWIAENVTIYNLGPVKIGDHTVISQDSYICAGTHDYTIPDLPLLRPGITIGHGVWVCAGAFVGPGVVVGNNSVVGARAVVTQDVPPGMIVAGNPAKVIKPRKMKPQTPSN